MVNTSLTYSEAPLNLRDKVCWPSRCTGTNTLQDWEDRYGPYAPRHRVPVHYACNRPHFGVIYRCVVDGSLFIRDFSDPRFCFHNPRCWDHLLELPGNTYCTEHQFPYLLDEDRFPRFPPQGLNPRKYSAEELADVFDF